LGIIGILKEYSPILPCTTLRIRIEGSIIDEHLKDRVEVCLKVLIALVVIEKNVDSQLMVELRECGIT